MRKVIACLVGLMFILSVMGCATIVVKAPKGKNLEFSSVTPTEWDKSKMVWYVLWGLIPLGDNSTADLLTDVPNGSTVAVQSQLTVVDALLSWLLSVVTIQTRSVSIAVTK